MPRLTVWMVRAALLHLGAGFTFGALMLLNKGAPVSGEIWRLLWPHVELVLLGWTLQLGMGVAFWIMPRFSGERRYGRVWLGWAAFGLLNAGVVVVIGGQVAGEAGLVALGRALEVLAAGAFALHLWPRVKPLGGQAAGNKSNVGN